MWTYLNKFRQYLQTPGNLSVVGTRNLTRPISQTRTFTCQPIFVSDIVIKRPANPVGLSLLMRGSNVCSRPRQSVFPTEIFIVEGNK